MNTTLEAIHDWLEQKYDGYSVETKPVEGTHGLIWFLNANSASTKPSSFAIKTVNPKKIDHELTEDDLETLRREFRMWLALPPTYNVLPALGFDIATLSGSSPISIPVMRMPRMKGSLRDWMGKPDSKETLGQLIALAQALNGLQYLYDHGFEGHGDLKPENLLYDDLREKFQLKDDHAWPSSRHYLRVRVADLGWADAWAAFGVEKCSTKAWRLYLAPERLEKRVIPIKSDIFSMGIVASELLQGCHPAPNPKKLNESEGKWKEWANSGIRNLEQIKSPRLKRIIKLCLDPSPDARPDALSFLDEVCAELKLTYGFGIEQTLKLWRSPVSGDDPVAKSEHVAWAATQSLRLGTNETEKSFRKISEQLQQINVIDFESCELWVPRAEAAISLAAGNPEEEGRIREHACKYLVSILGKLDRSAIGQLLPRNDWPKLRGFERFSELVTRMAEISGKSATDNSEFLHELNAYGRSALFFGWASAPHQVGNYQAAIEMISSAIAETPDEPEIYYFRALWADQSRFVWEHKYLQRRVPEPFAINGIIEDLNAAISLDPKWEEPKQLLASLRGVKEEK